MALEDTLANMFMEPISILQSRLNTLKTSKDPKQIVQTLMACGYAPAGKNVSELLEQVKKSLEEQIESYFSALAEKYPRAKALAEAYSSGDENAVTILQALALKTAINEYDSNESLRNKICIEYANQLSEAYGIEEKDVIDIYKYDKLTSEGKEAIIKYIEGNTFEQYFKNIKALKTSLDGVSDAKNSDEIKSELAKQEKELEDMYYGLFGKYDELKEIDEAFINEIKAGNPLVISVFNTAAEVIAKSAYSTLPDSKKTELGKSTAEQQKKALEQGYEQVMAQIKSAKNRQPR